MGTRCDEAFFCRFESDFAPGEVDTIYADDEEPIRVLRIGNAFQSATYLGNRKNELPFEYFRRFDCLLEIDEGLLAKHRVLLLGAGAFSYPKHLLTRHVGISMVAVERDPKIVEVARAHFFLDDLEEDLALHGGSQRLEIQVSDAREFLEGTTEAFSVIIDDLFDGEESDGSLATLEGFELVKRHLAPDGLFLVNYVCEESIEAQSTLHGLLDDMQGAFGHAQALLATDAEFSDFDNYILAASAADYRFEGPVIEP